MTVRPSPGRPFPRPERELRRRGEESADGCPRRPV